MSRRLKLIPYIGGKHHLAPKIVEVIQRFYPYHTTYVEVFGGGLSVFLAKDPSPIEVVNDIDSLIVNLYRVMRDPQAFRRFLRMVFFTPYARSEHAYAQRKIKEFRKSGLQLDPERPDPLLAWCVYVDFRMSISGQSGNRWGYAISSRRGKAALAHFAGQLMRIHKRFMRVQIEQDDFRMIIHRYDSPKTVFYLDPPYVRGVRRSPKLYFHEMSLEDHQDLVELLLKIQGGAVLSCYFHEVYQPLIDHGWIREDIEMPLHSIGSTRASGFVGDGIRRRHGHYAIETLLIKPPNPGYETALPLLGLLNRREEGDGHSHSREGFDASHH